MPAPASGGCLCGQHRFQSLANPRFVAHCHCESCRRSVAAPVATYVGFLVADVEFSSPAGIDDIACFQSSPGVRRGFCNRCGSALYYASDQWPGEIHLFRSTFADPDRFEATAHVAFEEHEIDLYDDLPRYAAFSGAAPVAWGHKPAFRILYLCTGNSARSILAEGITNLRAASTGARRIRAHSAGSAPAGEVQQPALQLLAEQRYLLGELRSKSWNEFCTPASPAIDLVITLCDSAADTECPVFPGPAEKRHWGMPDPASGAVSFTEAYRQLDQRITDLLSELGA